MLLEISHFTHYRYAEPVSLSPHVFRLRPREDGAQRLRSFQLNLEPAAKLISTHLEPDGNVGLKAWFEGTVQSLRVHTRSVVETHRSNPYDFLISSAEAMSLPVRYEDRWREALGASLAPVAGPSTVALAEELAQAAGFDTLQFLALLNRRLSEQFRVTVRLAGEPMEPDQAFSVGEVACRDIAMVFVAACRHFGLAARFVSGYQLLHPSEQERYMHAWAEVFLPGGGWRGFDPTHNVAVDEHYVPVAASALPSLAAPIEGTYAPGSVSSRIEVHLDVRGSCLVPRSTHSPGQIADRTS